MNLVSICMHYKACRTKHAEQSAKRLFSKACISACIQEKTELPGTVLRPEVLL